MPSKRFPSATGPLVGALAGLVVGIADGLRAGWLVGASSGALIASAILAGAADALLGVAGIVAFLLLWKTRAPLHGHALAVCLARAVAIGAITPWFVGSAATVRLGLRWRTAALLAGLLFVVPGVAAVVRSWSDNLR